MGKAEKGPPAACAATRSIAAERRLRETDLSYARADMDQARSRGARLQQAKMVPALSQRVRVKFKDAVYRSPVARKAFEGTRRVLWCRSRHREPLIRNGGSTVSCITAMLLDLAVFRCFI
jgi:hypothetical protein